MLAEAGNQSFYDYLVDAQENFLRDSAKLIKKVAGGHAEVLTVKRSRSTCWLEYRGQDRSDMDLEWTASLIVREPDVTVYVDVRSVARGNSKRDADYKAGVLSPDDVLRLFLGSFGAA